MAADTPAESASARISEAPSPAGIPFVDETSERSETPRPPAPSRTSTVRRRHMAMGRPDRLVVPELGVDAPVIGIDVVDGVLLPPDDPQVLGWWQYGAEPGAKSGSALITGHTVSSGGGAFDHLETLEAGDEVRVRTTNGLIRYEVTGVRIFRKARLAQHAARVFNQERPGRLVLITCEDWNGSTYLSNAVVFAEARR
jgi:LPXTG-site transpeptidase (sortase) family protein